MAKLNDLPIANLQFYATAPYPCSYLPGKLARSQVATPSYLIDTETYSALVSAGFRRSGAFTYRPYCDHCHACVPVRVVAAEFEASRAQRRAIARHQRPRAALRRAQVQRRALRALPPLPERAPSRRRHGPRQPRAVRALPAAVERRHATDRVPRGRASCAWCRSSTSWPTGCRRSTPSSTRSCRAPSYGTYNILWQIEEARRRGLAYVYLGYWIAQSRKMSYKNQFKPIEGLSRGEWKRLA